MTRDAQDFGEVLRELARRARIEGSQVWTNLLRDRELWNQAPKDAQDLAISQVTTSLGAGWKLIKTRNYRCGGLNQRIATIRYVGTKPRQLFRQDSSKDWCFNLIPGGRFTMGSPWTEAGRDNTEGPPRLLAIPPVLVGVTPATNSMWQRATANPRTVLDADRPKTAIEWNEVQSWAEALGNGLRLPSESEWEYFCRAGTTSRFTMGNDESRLSSHAWFDGDSSGGPTTVGQKQANAFGLYDLLGNVWEWCQDGWTPDYNDGPTDHKARIGKNPNLHVQRGGCSFNKARFLRSASRSFGRANATVGFRVVRDLKI